MRAIFVWSHRKRKIDIGVDTPIALLNGMQSSLNL